MHLFPVIFQITQPTGILETFVLERSVRIIFTRLLKKNIYIYIYISPHCERPLLFRHTCNKTLVYTTEILLKAVGLRHLTAAPRVTFLVAQESSHKNSSVTKTLREIMTSSTGYGTLSIEYKSNSNTINMILPLLSIIWSEQLHCAVIRDWEAHFNLLQRQILNCTRRVLYSYSKTNKMH
jgi:hypothetical protein